MDLSRLIHKGGSKITPTWSKTLKSYSKATKETWHSHDRSYHAYGSFLDLGSFTQLFQPSMCPKLEVMNAYDDIVEHH